MEQTIGGPVVCSQCGKAYNCITDTHVCQGKIGEDIHENIKKWLWKKGFTSSRNLDVADVATWIEEYSALQAQQISELQKQVYAPESYIEQLRTERDDFERKGKELCSAYGNSLIKIHDLEVANATHIHDLSHLQQVNCRLQGENAALKQDIQAWKNGASAMTGIAARSREAQPREGALDVDEIETKRT